MKRFCPARGFTLIEVMVATVILSLVMGSLVMTFQTAMKAYSLGIGHAESEQTARFVMNQIADDLRNLFYKPASQYNVVRRQREQMIEQQIKQALQSGMSEAEIYEEMGLEDLGPEIDLSFRGQDNGESDDLTFVRSQHLTRREDRKMWGLARVRYAIEGGELVRSLDDVLAPEVDDNGNEIPKPVEPVKERMARDVEGFDVKYGYYYGGEWYSAPDWDSNENRYRNPTEDDEGANAAAALGITDPNRALEQAQNMPPDNVPAWVEVTVVFRDTKNPGRKRTYRQVVQLPQSQETYIPPQEDTNARRTLRSRRGERADSGGVQ